MALECAIECGVMGSKEKNKFYINVQVKHEYIEDRGSKHRAIPNFVWGD